MDVKVGAGDAVFSIGDHGPVAQVAGQPLTSQGLTDVFVMKQSADGTVLWIQEAGGPGMDIAGKVCPAPDGSVVVCGQFNGTADLFGTTVTAQGGSTDFFVARLAGSDGQAIWVRTGGGAAYSDRASGVAVTNDGRVVVTGEFRGTAVFDAGTFSSTIDPGSGLPGSDVFVMSYTANGTAEWFRQGVAKYNDQAADVVVDGAGAAYAFGSYSDTLSFGITHPGTALNQIFTVKFAADGTEQWFRRIGGAALQRPADLQLDGSGSLYLCGDVQGTLNVYDSSPNTIANADPFAYFLLRLGTDGEFQSGIATGSTSQVHADALDQRGSSVAVLGSFECQFSELATHYVATGLFIATGTEDLFITRHVAGSLTLDEAQQFGGHSQKNAGGIASLTGGDLLFSGSFEELLIFPGDALEWGEVLLPCTLTTCAPDTFCGDPNYNAYEAIESLGLSDGFLARGYVEDRQPYDPYCRSGDGCDRPALDLVVFSYSDGVTDNVVVCAQDVLGWVPNIPRPGDPPGVCDPSRTISWDVDAVWNTGSTTDTIVVLSSGWYWHTHISSNGCYSVTDSIYVTVLPTPQAWVSADGGPFFSGPGPNQLSACQPMTFLAGDLLIGETAQWFVDGIPVPDNPVVADAAGQYMLQVTSPNGCVGTNTIAFSLLDTLGMPDITGVDFEFLYQGVPLAVQDTVPFCGGLCLSGEFVPTWYVGGVPTVLTQPYYLSYETDGGCGLFTTYPNLPMGWSQLVGQSGWVPLHVHVVMYVEGCLNDSLVFDAYDTVYIAVSEPPQIAPFEDLYMCAGDTAVMVLDCIGCGEVEWSGPGVIAVSAGWDTAWVNQFGFYSVIASSEAGVLCVSADYFEILLAEPPALLLDPPDGAVCPGGSALLYTMFDSDIYEWTGPAGPLQVNNDTVTISEIGAYYLTVYTDQGCQLSNGPAYLQEFGSPSLSAFPDNVLCPGQVSALQIFGGGITSVVWLPPLTGGDLTQTVSQAGTYSCVVTSCGIDFPLSIVVQASTINAVIPPGPFTICGGGSVLLDGPTGDYDYLWTPGGAITEDLLATGPGGYQVQITDSLGCSAASNIAVVIEQSFNELITTEGDSICLGDDVQLVASGSGTITWYADAGAQQTLAVNDSLLITAPPVSDTVYVTQTEDGCTGPAWPVVIIVSPPPAPPVITGDTSLCIGDALLLSVLALPGLTYFWTTPQGTVAGPTVSLASLTAQDLGEYICVASVGDCGGSQTSVQVVLAAGPEAPVITGDATLCLGESLLLSVPAIPGIAYTWTTPQGQVPGTTVEVAAVAAGDAGTYTCVPAEGACIGEAGTVIVTVQIPPEVPGLVGPDTLCEGDYITLSATGVVAGSFVWVTPGGEIPGSSTLLATIPATVGNSGSYGVVVDGGECPDASTFIDITVNLCEVIIPNVFTPNADGENDYFIVRGPAGGAYHFRVFNRWGQEVYFFQGMAIAWNGYDDQHGMLPDGVYYYELEQMTSGSVKTYTGYIQLLRGK